MYLIYVGITRDSRPHAGWGY